MGSVDQQPEREVLRSMAAVLSHRGPDGEGIRVGPGYGFAHRRLAIVDIAGGAQPMQDGSGRTWVTFNGEIYNHEELRQELTANGHRFVTRADTEVLVHGWRQWGAGLAERLEGMFAFAVADEDTHELFLARDRLGKKPLYYTFAGDDLLFASELKALLADPRVEPRLSPESLGQFLCLGYVPDPATIYQGIHKLPPATTLHVQDGRPRLRSYWRLQFEPRADRTPAAAAEELLHLLDRAVAARLMGEVPLGAFLSGGVDSSAVVASMARQSRRVVACSVGFADRQWDERPHARAVAAAVGAELHEGVVTVAEMQDLSWFAEVFDEPFADESAIPTWHVSRLARRHVTVALSGDGGDESFGGYRRYRFDVLENRHRDRLPAWLWRTLGAVYPKLDFLPRFLRLKRTLENLGRSPDEAYARSVSRALPEQVLPLLRPAWRTGNPLRPLQEAYRRSEGPALSRCAATDFQTWLPGDVLAKVDRASMAVSLEVRAPFLDHRLVEFAATLPAEWHLHGGRGKAFLRQALAGRLAPTILDRTKQGFSVPMRDWMAGDLGADLAHNLAAAGKGRSPLDEILDTGAVSRLLERHRSGLRDHGALLWSVSVLSRFLDRWVAA